MIMSEYTLRIIDLASCDSFLISKHARIRMFERYISTEDMIYILKNGEIIEQYSDDEPCPSVLMLGYISDQPYHLVVGICEDHLRIITAYTPDESHWIDSRRRR